MSWQEWLTICEWMTTRWPDFARTEEPVIRAMYEDLKLYDGHDVHEAVIHLHRNGRESPPKGSTILKTLKEFGTNPALVFDRDHCDHIWALPTDWEVTQDVTDKKVCVRCKREVTWERASAVKSDWLLQQREREQQEREEKQGEEIRADEEGHRGEDQRGAESPF